MHAVYIYRAVNVYMFICISEFLFWSVHICRGLYVVEHKYIYLCCEHKYMYTYIHIYKYTHAMYIPSYRGIRKYTWIYIAKSLQHRYTPTHTRTHTLQHRYTPTHTHTHTHTHHTHHAHIRSIVINHSCL